MKTAAKVANLSYDLFIFALIKIEYYGTTGQTISSGSRSKDSGAALIYNGICVRM